MRGRYTAISFILFANIMLLVHALVPHHHHKGIICFTEEISTSGCNHQNHNHDCDKNHDSEKDDSGCCVVKQDYLVPTDEIGKTARCVVNEIHNRFLNWFIPILTNGFDLQVISESKFKFRFFDDLPQYSCWLKSNLSLRAPPSI